VHGLYWNTSLGAGMDNSPREGSGWVDMSSQMVLMYDSLAQIANVLEKSNDALKFTAQAQSISQRINQSMWNEQDGIYYDVNDDGSQTRHKTIAGFWPMLAGIAKPAQVSRMVATLENPKLFWRSNVFPSLAADQPEYYPGGDYWVGSVWAPTNVMVIQGLERYETQVPEARDLLSKALSKYLHAMSVVYASTHTLWENYAPDALTQGSVAKGDFVGWTGAAPIQLLIEEVLGFRADAIHGTLTWDLKRTDAHGISNLRFGQVTANLSAKARASSQAPAELTVESDHPFRLIVRQNTQESTVPIATGSQTVSCDETGKCSAKP
jgi:glycogen debranching enzyme